MDVLKDTRIQVGLLLIFSLMVIIYFNPPHTPCQSQIEIYTASVNAMGKNLDKAMKTCKEHTDPGGCMPFIELVNKLEAKYTEVGHQCQPSLKSNGVTREWITVAMEILVKAAWGSQPPISISAKNGWLELTQVIEFCRLKQHLEMLYGKDYWNEFTNNMLSDFPGASSMNRNDAWNKSLLSDSCQYPL